MLKPCKVLVVQTRGTNNRTMLEEYTERVEMW